MTIIKYNARLGCSYIHLEVSFWASDLRRLFFFSNLQLGNEEEQMPGLAVRTPPTNIRIPNIMEPFRLTLDPSELDPMRMPLEDGTIPERWSHKGPVVKQARAGLFMLAQLDARRDLQGVRRAHKPHGGIPEGVWLRAFTRRFPRPDLKGPIGIADPSWTDASGHESHPCLGIDDDSWYPAFQWAEDRKLQDWRWLIAIRS